ncbi:MAG: hypothetical protein IPJ38_23175 [Dechloromonas sp.]|uniref:Uncharacterized protein n=1 Tax=Candidatus Dechloromonas phosphorivorans TaxID=2899244 RepID=A0A935K173_9RHOO|nr:hypothetical protein [Candidatus Dechloromonas phosphorivorans]
MSLEECLQVAKVFVGLGLNNCVSPVANLGAPGSHAWLIERLGALPGL